MISVAYKHGDLQVGEELISSFKIYVGCSCSVKILAFGGFVLGLLSCSVKKKIFLASSGLQLESSASQASKHENQVAWHVQVRCFGGR